MDSVGFDVSLEHDSNEIHDMQNMSSTNVNAGSDILLNKNQIKTDEALLSGLNSSSAVSFSEYGNSFQEKIFQALLADQRWSLQMLEIIRMSYFDSKPVKYLVEKYYAYYMRYKCFPTWQLLLTILKDDLRTTSDAVLRAQVIECLKRIKSDTNVGDLAYVREKSFDFCRQQALKEALEKAVDLIAREQLDSVIDVVKSALIAGVAPAIGHDFFDDIDARFIRINRDPIATGIEVIDKKGILNGGLGKGELGIFIGSVGSGKSHALVMLGAEALKQGKTVLHYTLELSEMAVGIRYDSYLCGIPSNDIPDNQNYVKKFYENSNFKKLIIKEYPTGSASTLTIKSHIEKLRLRNIIPDIIIIDYADIMRSTSHTEMLRQELKLIYEQLRNMAMELQLPIWSACFHGDTTISSPCGKFKIKDMVGKTGFPVFSYDHDLGRLVCKTVKSVYKSGTNCALVKVTLDNGKEIIVTPTHKFMLRDGSYKEVKDLSIGESLMPFNRKMHDGRKKIYLNNGKWEYQYRLVAEWKFGKIPKYHQIHHIDMNKFNDHPDNLELLTISEHYAKHGRAAWDEHNPCNIAHLREAYSERMKTDNPMFKQECIEKMRLSRKGKLTGDDNPMMLLENQEKVSKSLRSSEKFAAYVAKIPEIVNEIWNSRTDEQRAEIGRKISASHEKRFGAPREFRIKELQTLASSCKSFSEFKEKAKKIPLRGSDKLIIWNNRNHKVVSIEPHANDDVYNMEVEDLHNYALDAGIVVKNSQSNRSGANADIIGMENMSESYGKAMVADVILSLSRKPDEKATGAGRLFVAKNRAGRDGIVFNLQIDTSQSRFTVIDDHEQLLSDVKQNDEYDIRERLAEKWKALNKSKLAHELKLDS